MIIDLTFFKLVTKFYKRTVESKQLYITIKHKENGDLSILVGVQFGENSIKIKISFNVDKLLDIKRKKIINFKQPKLFAQIVFLKLIINS